MMGSDLCKQAELYYCQFIDNDDQSSVPTDIIDHIDACIYCQEKLIKLQRSLNSAGLKLSQRRRDVKLLGRQLGFISKPVTCDIVKPFLPSMLNSQIKVATPITVHLENCLQCRLDLEAIEKLNLSGQQLNEISRLFSKNMAVEEQISSQTFDLPQIIHQIAQRPNSPVSTICSYDKSASKVKVRVLKSRHIVHERFFQPAISKAMSVNLRPFLKPALTAAAVILIGFGYMFFNTPKANAVSYDQVCRAIEKARNVYIKQFGPDRQQVQQEKWISKNQNIYMTRTKQEIGFWDISGKIVKVKDCQSNITKTVTMNQELRTLIKKNISGSLGLLPFDASSDIPADSQWTKIETLSSNVPAGLEVYELTYRSENFNGFIPFFKWRVFLNPQTNLPQRTELYRKLSANQKYELRSVQVIEYPTDSQIQIVLSSLSLQ